MDVQDAVCTFCGCLCDDLQVSLEGGRITGVTRACATGKNKIMLHNENRASCRVGDREATLEEALDAAAGILSRALNPLIYGLSSTTCEAQRKAVELAEVTGANIDSTSSVCHGSGALARQAVGIATCTLGEVKNRADMVVFWGCNPAESHIRHAARYSVTAKGMHVPGGRKGRRVVAVDVRRTPTAGMADTFIQIRPGYDYECLSVMRVLLAGGEIDADEVGGVSVKLLKSLVDDLKSARYGVFFFGMGLTMSRGKFKNVAAALSLVRDLNRYTRFAAVPMRGHGNVAGAEQTLSWLTGFPFAVNFSRGYPRYGPGEFTAVDLLAKGHTDAVLVISSDPAAHFPEKAVKHLRRIPVIVLDGHENCTTGLAHVVIPVAMAGISAEGTAYRMDNVPLRLKKLIESSHPQDEQVLEMIKEKVLSCSR